MQVSIMFAISIQLIHVSEKKTGHNTTLYFQNINTISLVIF